MINTFIAAIVALFFWGKSSKDIEEKTQLASWLRTLVYGVLTFLVSVFYVKTYQVATVHHNIELKGLRTSRNANNNVADTVDNIYLVNRYSSYITEDYEIRNTALKNEMISDMAETGGLYVSMSLQSGSEYKTKNKSEINNTSSWYLQKNFLGGQLLESYSHAYQLDYITSSIPSLVPLLPTGKYEKDTIESNGVFIRKKWGDCGSFGNEFTSFIVFNGADDKKYKIAAKDFLRDKYYITCVLAETVTQPKTPAQFSFEHNSIHDFNFFTAADISQYTCDINLKSDCYVKNMEINHDLPIEINPHDSCMRVSSYSIILKRDFLNNQIVNKGNYKFHIKFPTLANLQLIRSLILTTLLTALVSLFFCNLFYLVRKKILSFKEKHISQINVEKAKRFRKKICVLALVFMIFIVYIAYRIWVDHPFHIKDSVHEWLNACVNWIVAGIIILLCLLFYFMFRKAYNIKK